VKQGIHPEFSEVLVKCPCGATYTTKSTSKKIYVEICSKCHPFYTGKQKLIDSAGKIEKFKKRYSAKKITAEENK